MLQKERELSQRRLMELPQHLQNEVRSPARLCQGISSRQIGNSSSSCGI